MKRFIPNVALGVIVVLLALLIVPLGFAFAATTADISINATPAYVSISNSPSTYGFGVVETSTNYDTATGYFTITNSSTVNIDISISTNATWAGGNTWAHNDSGSPGAEAAAMKASPNDGAFNIIVKNATPNNLYSNEAGASLQWELRLAAPTSFDDGVLKTNTVTLTASVT